MERGGRGRPATHRTGENRRDDVPIDAVPDAVYEVVDGRLVAVNDAFVALTGYDREELLGADAGRVLARDARERHGPAVRSVATGAADRERLDVTVETADGRTVACDLRLGPRRADADGRGAVGVLREVRAQAGGAVDGRHAGSARQADDGATAGGPPAADAVEAALAAERDRFPWLVEAVEEYAIFMLDADGHVVTWNLGAERIKGYPEKDALGRHVSTFYTEADREAGVPAENLRRAAEEGSTEDEGWRVRADGSRFWACVTITALYDDGDLLGYAKVTRDMTDRREREQELRHEHDLVERILETSPVGIAVFSPDGTVERANWRAAASLGLGADADGSDVEELEIYDGSGERVPTEDWPLLETIADGGTVSDWELRVEKPDGDHRWWSVNATPVTDEDGAIERVVTAGEDITQLKEQAEMLERRRDELEAELEEVFERIDDGFYALDDRLRFRYVNERAEELLDCSEEELLGESVWEVFPEAMESPAWDSFYEALETQEPTSYEVYYEPLGFWVGAHVYPSETGLSVYFRDVTDRKQYEQTLTELHDVSRALSGAETREAVAGRTTEAAEEVLDLPGVTVYLHDGDAGVLYPAAHSSDMEDLYGELPTVDDGPDGSIVSEAFDRGETVVHADVQSHALLANPSTEIRRGLFIPLGEHGVFIAGDRSVGGFADATVELAELLAASAEAALDRVDRERRLRERRHELEQYETIVETVDDGVYVVDGEGRFLLVNEAYAELTGYDREELVGAHCSKVVDDEVVEEADEIERALAGGESVESTFEAPIRRADGTTVEAEASFALIPGEDGQRRVGVVRDVSERNRRERKLRRQRDQLEALVGLTAVVRNVNRAVVEQSTREEIERLLCECLAASPVYGAAWLGDIDRGGEEIRVRARAGDADVPGELPESVTDPAGDGPAARALGTQEMQVVRDTEADGADEPWREHAAALGYRSSAAIPISHEGVCYGVLNVYADRAGAFDGQEGAVMADVGDIVGHAVSAVERKRALMSDEVVEIEFRLRGFLDAHGVEASGGRIEIERTIPTSDGEFVQYVSTTPDAADTLQETVDALPHADDWTLLSEHDDRCRFEVTHTSAPMMSLVATHGGRARRATIEDGDLDLQVELPPSADVRTVVESVTEEYPDLEVVAQRRSTRSRPADEAVRTALTDDLTDRQRSVLEAAYFAGFFEWPRDATAEELASSMGVASPTLHQHLRKALGKLLDAVFEPETGEA